MKKAIVAALIAAFTVTAAFGTAAALGNGKHQGHAASGKRGPRGRRGPRGIQGPAGPAGIARVIRVDGPAAFQGAFGSGQEVKTSTATCPAGYYVTGGGYVVTTIDNIVSFSRSSVTQYSVIAVNEYGASATVTAQAICAAGAGLSASRAPSKATPATVLKRQRQLQAAVDANSGR